jgi:hypothetical protein
MKCIIIIMLLVVCKSHAQWATNSSINIGSTALNFKQTCFDTTANASTITFINLHQDENTSVAATMAVLGVAKKYCVAQIIQSSTRSISFVVNNATIKVDPNRIYTPTGAAKTIADNNPKLNAMQKIDVQNAVAKFKVAFINKYITNKALVVALHNNLTLSMNTYIDGNEKNNVLEKNYAKPQQAHDFFLTTEKRFYDYLAAKGYNVVLQNNAAAKDDGSLSVYAGKNSIPYINVEALRGHLAQQKLMLQAVLDLIKHFNL